MVHGNVNRLFDTKGMNRILGKPLKTRGSGILGVAEIPCLILEPCQCSAGAAVTDSHSGHESDPSVAVLTFAAKGLTPMVVNVTPVVTIFAPSTCPMCPLCFGEPASTRLKKAVFWVS